MVAESTTWNLQQKPPFVGDSKEIKKKKTKPEKVFLDLLLVDFEEKVVKSCKVLY